MNFFKTEILALNLKIVLRFKNVCELRPWCISITECLTFIEVYTVQWPIKHRNKDGFKFDNKVHCPLPVQDIWKLCYPPDVPFASLMEHIWAGNRNKLVCINPCPVLPRGNMNMNQVHACRDIGSALCPCSTRPHCCANCIPRSRECISAKQSPSFQCQS